MSTMTTRGILALIFCSVSLGLTFMVPATVSAETIQASDDRLVTEADLIGMSASELRIARNEIFARHGYAFNSSELQTHFFQYPWYRPITKNVTLSSIENANVAFIKRYEDSSALQARLQVAPPQPVISRQTTIISQTDSIQLADAQAAVDNLAAQIASLKALLRQQSSKVQEGTGSSIHTLAEIQLKKQLRNLKSLMNTTQETNSKRYNTSIQPKVDHSVTNPRDLVRHFPKIPWYDPQYADQIGEFWLEYRVSDAGVLLYDLKFLEPEHTTQNVASEFTLPPADAEIVLAALTKTYTWSETAKENNVRDLFRKMVACTPDPECSEKRAGNTSTQVDFLVLEQGATGARLIRNKGAFKEEYGLSIESAALLASYFEFVLEIGKDNFEAGSRTSEQLDGLFE